MIYPPRHLAALFCSLLLCLACAPAAAQQWTASVQNDTPERDLGTLDRQIIEWVKEKRSLQQYIQRTRQYLDAPHSDHCRALLELREYERQYHWIEVQVQQAQEERARLVGTKAAARPRDARRAELDFYLVNNMLELDRLSCELLHERQILFALYGEDATAYRTRLTPLLQRYAAFRQKLLMQRIQWQQERTALASGTEELQHMLALKSALAEMSWWRCLEQWLQQPDEEATPALPAALLDAWFADMEAWASYYRLAAPLLEGLPAASPLDAFHEWQQWLPPLTEEQARQAIVLLVRHFDYSELGDATRTLRRWRSGDHLFMRSHKPGLVRYGIDLEPTTPDALLAAFWPAFAQAWQQTEPAGRSTLWLAFAWLFR